MKHRFLNEPYTCTRAHLAFVIFLAVFSTSSFDVFAQTQLTFTGTPVVTGTAGAVNTTYTYNNVGSMGSTTIRGVIKIVEKTGGASLYTIDASSGGAANAWQPVINGPSTANGACWGITFNVSFYDASTGFPLTLSSFRANGIDIDGDGGNLREYNEPYNLSSYTVENPTSLTVSPVTVGYHFRSPQTAYDGISISQTNVAATWYYENIQSMSIKIGSCCVGGTCSATGSTSRQSSINFYDAVAYNVGTTVLPVNFLSVSGVATTAGNRISWDVSGQASVVEYIVEKSSSAAGAFEHVKKVPARSDALDIKRYTAFDENADQRLYYRVKAIGKDGAEKQSQIIRISNSSGTQKFSVINDGRSKTVVFDLDCQANTDLSIRVTDMNGKTLHQQKTRSQQGSTRYSLANFTLPGKGIFLLHVHSSRGNSHMGKIVVY